MKNFNRNSAPSFRGKPRRDDRGGDRQMHRATCSDCGRSCEVPFRPTGDKPIYCSNCFQKDDSPRGGGRDDRRDDHPRGRDRRDDRGGDRQMHRATCDECGRNCEVPFRPTGDKPIYCSDCFGRGDNSGRNSGAGKADQSSKKQDEIIAKLDKILFLLQRTVTVKDLPITKEKVESKPAPKAVKAAKTVVKKAATKDAKKSAPKKAAPKRVAKKVTVKKKSK